MANLFLPQWAIPEVAEAFANEAASHSGVVLGAYCGAAPAQTRAAMDSLLAAAAERHLDLDLHIDETNNPACCATAMLVESLTAARAAGYKGHVVLSHVTSLALQEQSKKDHIVAALARLGPITVVACPHTNLRLQDRRGTEPPIGISVPEAHARTPHWRGITLVQELADNGVAVAAASDNVRDYWHPYGDLDCMAVFADAMAMAHLDTAPSEGEWAHMVSRTPAAAMGLPARAGIVAGAPADLILFPGLKRMSELLARPQLSQRVVIRRGRVQHSQLPSFSELDDLVTHRTQRIQRDGPVLRGASVTAP